MPTEPDTPTLTLSDALKLAGLVRSGGQAKQLIQAGEVKVNGVVETRRKRRLRPGDEIELGGESFVIELETSDSEAGNLESDARGWDDRDGSGG